MRIQLAHSPDPDDAFMFYALAKNKISLRNFSIVHVFSDIETLNQAAFQGKFEITALSLHAYAYVSDKYWLLPNGASIGKGYGPLVVARKEVPFLRLHQLTIGVPGKYTTAALALGLAIGKFNSVIIPFDEIIPAVVQGKVDAGLLIHEGQLTYGDSGLVKILDVGEWWHRKTGLTLPLGVDAVRKDLGVKTAKELSDLLLESIKFAMNHEDEALEYALKFGRGLTKEKARTFVRMYVNERTLGYSDEDKKAVSTLLLEGYDSGILPFKPEISFEIKN